MTLALGRRRVALVVVGLLVAALVLPMFVGVFRWLSPSDLPDRSDPAVLAEERRLEGLVEGTPLFTELGAGIDCRVRLLRSEPPTSWAWTVCVSDTSPATYAVPFRVDGDQVSYPDTADAEQQVRQMFPPDLVDVALGSPNELFADLGIDPTDLPTPLPPG
ncbi:hypothetical protein [Intrasporangium flavum]|uniref:hypothetical protein n=1 Tax=Intrasporangium flavum TaxID=1428657 RepID=UPI00096CEFE4|nr:hypothetical protein [Intrasporangium flavum]